MNDILIFESWLNTPNAKIVRTCLNSELIYRMDNIYNYMDLSNWYNEVRQYLILQIKKYSKLRKNNLEYFKYFYTGDKTNDLKKSRRYLNVYLSIYELSTLCLNILGYDNGIKNYINYIKNCLNILWINHLFLKEYYDIFKNMKLNNELITNETIKYTLIPFL
jgi:hypothetical protein